MGSAEGLIATDGERPCAASFCRVDARYFAAFSCRSSRPGTNTASIIPQLLQKTPVII